MHRIQVAISALLIAAGAAGCSDQEDRIMAADAIISVQATCNDESECVWQGEDFPIQITVKNISAETFAVPVAYLRKTGPAVVLVDKRSDVELPLRPNLADPALKDDPQRIAPGETFMIDWIIFASEVEQLSQPLDARADVTVLTDVLAEGNVTREAMASTSLPIVLPTP